MYQVLIQSRGQSECSRPILILFVCFQTCKLIIIIITPRVYIHIDISHYYTSKIPVHVSIKSTVQTPVIGTYCFVIILIISCATKPPKNAAVLGRSAVGDRALVYIENNSKDGIFNSKQLTFLLLYTQTPVEAPYPMVITIVLPG